MIVWAPSQRPVKFPIVLSDWQIIDGSDPAAHQAMVVEFPVFVAIGAEPVSAVLGSIPPLGTKIIRFKSTAYQTQAATSGLLVASCCMTINTVEYQWVTVSANY